ncbi:MAG TPA: sigma-70 family RNA polymerase sigma factor [Ilumatobacter sp.]|nr:sigma-70 family RNA polymerase sigma factor [Ilumatobacter sp.]
MSEHDAARTWDVSTEAGLLACYDTTFAAVYRYTARLTGDRSASEDVTQEAYIRLVRAARAGQVGEIGIGWLLTTARRIWLDRVRSADRERARLRLVASQPAAEPATAAAHSDLLAGLSERERTALVLRYVDDLPVSEVAELLGTSVRATESLLQRAKRRARGDSR